MEATLIEYLNGQLHFYAKGMVVPIETFTSLPKGIRVIGEIRKEEDGTVFVYSDLFLDINVDINVEKYIPIRVTKEDPTVTLLLDISSTIIHQVCIDMLVPILAPYPVHTRITDHLIPGYKKLNIQHIKILKGIENPKIYSYLSLLKPSRVTCAYRLKKFIERLNFESILDLELKRDLSCLAQCTNLETLRVQSVNFDVTIPSSVKHLYVESCNVSTIINLYREGIQDIDVKHGCFNFADVTKIKSQCPDLELTTHGKLLIGKEKGKLIDLL
jgi:hypothetical protein